MASGKAHDRATWFVSGLLLTTAIHPSITSAEGLCLGLGSLIGGLWLSPDLDQPHTLPSQRWGIFKFAWHPYRLIVPHHRHWYSHSPIASTAFVLVYCTTLLLLPLLILVWLTGKLDLLIQWSQILVSNLYSILAFCIGVEVSRDLHLIMDWHYSLTRRWSRRK